MAQVIIQENLFDGDFIEKWTEGFQGFNEIALREEYKPEKVADLCGIQHEQIKRTARLFAQHSPPSSWGVVVLLCRGADCRIAGRCTVLICLPVMLTNLVQIFTTPTRWNRVRDLPHWKKRLKIPGCWMATGKTSSGIW